MSEIGKIFHPLFAALAYLIAVFYSWWPSYAFAISMLTVAVMVVLAPLTIKSTRSMLAMQRLAPELKRIQQKYKNDRQRLNEEMMAFYKEHGINPLGGCLPTLLQLPVFFVMYDVIEGLTNKVGPHHVASPKYISHSTLLYKHLIAAHGTMVSFGLDLAKSVTSVAGDLTKLPYAAMILLAIALQYIQIRQLNGRNPQAAAANPQAQTVQKIMPIVFAIIYISIPAGVNVYFVVSSLFRIVQQELMYRFDPAVKSSLVPIAAGPADVEVGPDTKGPIAGRRRPPANASGTKAGPPASARQRGQARPNQPREAAPKNPKGSGSGASSSARSERAENGGRSEGAGRPRSKPALAGPKRVYSEPSRANGNGRDGGGPTGQPTPATDSGSSSPRETAESEKDRPGAPPAPSSPAKVRPGAGAAEGADGGGSKRADAERLRRAQERRARRAR
jgi:YidC/Oxa1 family membrane protein insertase